MKRNTIVCKIGTAVLTRKSKKADKLDLNVLNDLAEEISKTMEDFKAKIVLVSSGAIGSGKAKIQLNSGPENTVDQAYASVGQSVLMSKYQDAFNAADPKRTVAQLLLTSAELQRTKEEKYAENLINYLLDNKIVPIVNANDAIDLSELLKSDNDNLAQELAIQIRANLLILLTNVEGFYEGDDLISQISYTQLDEDYIKKHIKTKSHSGRGGMDSKLLAARKAAEKGIPTYIVNGKDPGNLSAIIRGEAIGTKITTK
ncbi:glutamate 5-kinase [Candidatus Peregrinibacteria bacterium]|nr:glutamate 5-kinase [Candidatus Peregrinibacteria bacterium]